MQSTTILINESDRLRSLCEKNLPATGARRKFDAFADVVVVFTYSTSISLIRLVDMNRQSCISASKPSRDWSCHANL